MTDTDLEKMTCTVLRPGVEFECVGWLAFEDYSTHVEGYVTLIMWPHQVLELFKQSDDGWMPAKPGGMLFEVESYVTYRSQWSRFLYEAALDGAEDLHRGVPAKLWASFIGSDEVVRWLNRENPNIARPEDLHDPKISRPEDLRG